MARKLSRRPRRSKLLKQSDRPSMLRLEPLENRVLLDVTGWWDEIGYRSASGGGVSYDTTDFPGQTQMVSTDDGDTVALWIEGSFDKSGYTDNVWVNRNEYVKTPIPFKWTVGPYVNTTYSESNGGIYARQYADDLGWWDLSLASGDGIDLISGDTKTYGIPINAQYYTGDQATAVRSAYSVRQVDGIPDLTELDDGTTVLRVISPATELSAAAGPNGTIVVAWTAQAIPLVSVSGRTGLDTEIYAKMWDGTQWVDLGTSAEGGGVSNDGAIVNEKPDVAVSDSGEIYISYTAIQPKTGQREIVVKKFGYDYGDTTKPTTSPKESDKVWSEVVDKVNVGLFGVNNTSGVSNDRAVSMDAAIAIDLDGNPIVTWCSVVDASNMEIFVKKWNGSTWEPLDREAAIDANFPDTGTDYNSDGHVGISNDPGISIQPDIVVADNGDVLVTWVNWSDWKNYKSSGIFVKVLHANADDNDNGILDYKENAVSDWQAYDTGTAWVSGTTAMKGLADDLGWYYMPRIAATSDGRPLVTWQGYQTGEEYRADRDNSWALPHDSNEHTPNSGSNTDWESPIMAVYASGYYLKSGDADPAFHLLYNSTNPWYFWEEFSQGLTVAHNRNSASPGNQLSWMPTALVDNEDQFIIAYTVMDGNIDELSHDADVYIQQWDQTTDEWVSYGKGGNNQGNDVFNQNITSVTDFQIGLIDFDGDSTTDYDVMMADGFNVYLYNRWDNTYELGEWSDTAINVSYGTVFDLKGEPEIEFGDQVQGSPLLAYLDDFTQLPYVLEWDGDSWEMVGGGVAGTLSGTSNISVQAGPNGQILLVYLRSIGGYTRMVSRYYDPDTNTWKNADFNSSSSTGVVTSQGPLNAAYYADFDGFNFEEEDFNLNQATWETDITNAKFGQRSPTSYSNWSWYFVPEPNFNTDSAKLFSQRAFIDAIQGDVNNTAGKYGVDANSAANTTAINDPGLKMVFTVDKDDNDDENPELDNPLDPTTWEMADLAPVTLTGEFLYDFEMVAQNYVTIQFTYKMYRVEKANLLTDLLTLQLVIDGNVVNSDVAHTNGNVDATTLTIQSDVYGSAGLLSAGSHTIAFRGVLITSGQSDDDGNEAEEINLSIDNVGIYQKITTSPQVTTLDRPKEGWILPTSNTTADGFVSAQGNSIVGPDPDDAGDAVAIYDFGGFLSTGTIAAGAGTQQNFVISRIVQSTPGEMVTSFRYRLDGGSANTAISIILQRTGDVNGVADGVVYTETLAVDLVDWYTTLGYGNDTGWWNGIQDFPEYTWSRTTANDVPAGTYQVTIRMTEGAAAGDELMLDNLSILTTSPTSVRNPIATLLPDLSFGVGFTTYSSNMSVYYTYDGNGNAVSGSDMNPYPDGSVVSWTLESPFNSGFYAGQVLQLDLSSGIWDLYGERIQGSSSIDFLGFAQPQNLLEGAPTDVSDIGGLGSYAYSMPGNLMYYLTDLCIGPASTLWITVQRGGTDWVDTDNEDLTGGPSGQDNFILHPWAQQEAPHGGDWTVESTVYDGLVFYWNPFVVPPVNLPGTAQAAQWVNAQLTPETTYHAYTDIQITGSNGQLPTVAWSGRSEIRAYFGSYAQRLEVDGTWGVLNTEGTQNEGASPKDNYWSSQVVWDMVSKYDGYPILTTYMGHDDVIGIREFRPEPTIPTIRITESSTTVGDVANDMIIEFGTTTVASPYVIDRSFTIQNRDDNAPLIIYSVELAGIGDSSVNPFSFKNMPDSMFPYVIQPGQSLSVAIRFDPSLLVDPKEFTAVVVVHSNATYEHVHDGTVQTNTYHPFGGYNELTLTAEAISTAEITVNPLLVRYPNTVVNQTSVLEVSILHDNNPKLVSDSIKLDIQDWFFSGDNYDVQSISFYDASSNQTTVWDGTTGLSPGDILTFKIAFTPDELAIFNQVFYVVSNDGDEPITAVSLTGTGVSGSQVTVIELDGATGDDASDDTLEFGSVKMGNTSTKHFRIQNNGTTDLTLNSIQNPDILRVTVLPSQAIPSDTGLILTAGSYLDVTVIYSPPATGQSTDTVIDPVILQPEGTELGYLPILVNSNDPTNPSLTVKLTGIAVPDKPIIQVTEDSGVTENDKRLEFGTVNLDQSAVTQTFVITNLGGSDLTIKQFLINDPSGTFTVSPANTASSSDDILLAMSESITITVSFKPTLAGAWQKTLTILSDSQEDYNFQMYLIGTAVDPELKVTDDDTANPNGVIQYKKLGIGLTREHTVTLTNVGKSDLTITGWSLTSGDEDVFQVEAFPGGNLILKTGTSYTFDITFAPGAIENYTGTITILSNDPNLTSTVSLSGEGVLPGTVAIVNESDGTDDGSINFNADRAPLVYGADEAAESFYIANVGASPLTITAIYITSTADPSSAISNSPFSVIVTRASDGYTFYNGLYRNISSDDITLAADASGTQLVTVYFNPENAFDGTHYVQIVTTSRLGDSTADVISTVAISGETYQPVSESNPDQGIIEINAKDGFPKKTIDLGNGRSATVQMRGNGTAKIVQDETSGIDIYRIVLVGTDSKSVLTVTGSKGTPVTVGGIESEECAVKDITMKNVTVTGIGLDLYNVTGTIKMQDITGGADIVIDNVSDKGLTLQIEDIGVGSDIRINNDGTVKSLKLTGTQAYGDIIIDGDLKSLTAKSATFTGALRADNILGASFSQLNGAAVSVSGTIKSLAIAKNLNNSLVLAGYDLGSDGRLGGTGTAADTLFANGSIAKISGYGLLNSTIAAGVKPDGFGNFFSPSQTASGTIGKVTFTAVEPNNGGVSFGIAATTSISSIKIGGQKLTPDYTNDDFLIRLFD